MLDLLNKLKKNFDKSRESKAPSPLKPETDADKNEDKKAEDSKPAGRKPNFFERKRFVDYEKNSESGDESKAGAKDDKE